jgi:hypothetical protein
MTTGNLGKLALLAISDISDQLSGSEENFESFRKRLAHRDEAMRTTVIGWHYKFGPLPNIL